MKFKGYVKMVKRCDDPEGGSEVEVRIRIPLLNTYPPRNPFSGSSHYPMERERWEFVEGLRKEVEGGTYQPEMIENFPEYHELPEEEQKRIRTIIANYLEECREWLARREYNEAVSRLGLGRVNIEWEDEEVVG